MQNCFQECARQPPHRCSGLPCDAHPYPQSGPEFRDTKIIRPTLPRPRKPSKAIAALPRIQQYAAMRELRSLNKLTSIITIFCAAAALLSCAADRPGQSPSTAMPSVSVSCGAAACRAANGIFKIYAYLTTSSCEDPYFGTVRLGSGEVFCSSGVGCKGSVVSWADASSGMTSSRAPAGTYTLCTVIDLNRNWVDFQEGADVGDAVGVIENFSLNPSSSQVTVQSFSTKF